MSYYQGFPEYRGSIAEGFLIGIALNITQAIVVWLCMVISKDYTPAMVGFGGWGLVQLIYMVPLYFFYRRQGKEQTAKGVLIAGCLVLLLNASCWGWIWTR